MLPFFSFESCQWQKNGGEIVPSYSFISNVLIFNGSSGLDSFEKKTV